jgi:hypothetical protein
MSKKLQRPSPSAHAADHKNKVRKGNDGKAYVSVADANGVYRWRRVAVREKAATKARTTGAGRGTRSSAARDRSAARPARPAAGRSAAAHRALLAARKKAEGKIAKHLDAAGLGAFKTRVLAAAWPCVVGSYRDPGRTRIPPGTSRIGGLPDVPAGFVWPTTTRGGTKVTKTKRATARARTVVRCPLSFIAQIDCADVAPFDLTGVLPASGLLSFFYDAGEPSTPSEWVAVVYTPAGTPLTPAVAPLELAKEDIYKPVLIEKFRSVVSLPRQSDDTARALFKGVRGDRSEIEETYYELVELVDDRGDAPVQLLGYPSYVQHGVTSPKHTLLFHMSPPGNYGRGHKLHALWPGYVFGDTGLLYCQIAEADLRARRFAKAWGATQCS